MKVIGYVSTAFLLLSAQTAAASSWAIFSLATAPQNTPKLVAAADKLMSSEAGKQFPGKVLLQTYIANGTDPATHAFVPIYKTAAERETFVQKMQADPAWAEFQGVLSEVGQPVSQILHRTMKSWGEFAETDQVWIGHAFQVSDPPAFQAAIEALMASPTGKSFPGQVYLSEVVAGGLSPVSHVISVGYASEAEMASWTQTLDASGDWVAYLAVSRKVANYLGASLSRNVKSWGPATLKDLAGD
jgi:hypothetical protein